MHKQSKVKLRLKDAVKENPRAVGEALFQILNLVISIFAFSVFIAAASAVASPSVKAQTSLGCCEKLKDKDIFCQNSLLSNCETKFSSAPTSCDSTSFCKLGCCYDSKEGTCAENTPRKVCGLSNGTWDSNGNCNIPQCQMGCCVLGDQASLTTLVRCKKLASYYGLETDYRSAITSEASCVAVAQASDKGACIITTGVETTCKLTSRADCKGLTHNDTAFNNGFLCSAEQLGTLCTRQARTGCIDGKDEVYWFDSCGNPENIYDADKVRSWNSGKILDKENSCNPNSANAKNPSCGNCEYYQGSMCGQARTGVEPRPSYGDYICRDLNCYDTSNGNDYKHGESWCVFDGAVGFGRDLVGSRHWRHLCVMGEEQVEPCDDYRQGICVQESANIEGLGNFTESMCRANAWKMCLDYNGKPNMKRLCEDNTDCMILSMASTDKESGFNFCAPKVPPGFELKSDGGGIAANTYCSLANQKCEVKYEKTLKGWECKQNCQCKEQAWINQINKLCTSMGDCGLKKNIAEKLTKEGYLISGTDKAPDEKSSEGGMGAFGGLMTGLGSALGASFLFNSFRFIPESAAGITVSLRSGVSGTKLLSEMSAESLAKLNPATKAILSGESKKGLTLNEWFSAKAGQGSAWNPYINMAASYAGAIVINQMFGLKGQSANLVTTIGVTTALATSLIGGRMQTQFLWLGKGAPWWGPTAWAIVVMIIVAAVLKSMGVGKTKIEEITFTCLPWQPPTGGEDCEKCNKEPIGGEFKPCSKYRCESLGASCSLLNEGTGNETCAWLNKDDSTAPKLKPWQDVLTKDHSYLGIKPCPPGPGCWKITRQGATDGCIKAYTPLTFGIETNEPAQCRVDTNHTAKFDDMQFYFGDNLYIYNHSMQMSLPAPAHLNAQAESPELKNDGKYTLYARCRDGNGNWNTGEMAMQFCVDAGPDTTPPVIVRTGIINGAPVAAGTTSTPLDIFLNEPSECKWSRTDQEYKNMNNTFACSSNIEQMEGDMTYRCSTTLTKIQDRVANTFYFRCKDQPWLTTNESDRNVNKESYVFKMQGTIPLNITNVWPNGTVKGGAEPVQVLLSADTVNGYSYGDSTCYYSIGGGYDLNMIEFFTTGTSHHEQNLDLWAGDYKFYVLCRDLAGNIDKNETDFTVELDKTAPLIVRAYQDGGMLKIITEEESDCRYGIKDCNYDFLSGTEMPFTNSTEHTAEWRTDITYYIKCMDQYGNMPVTSQCQMQVNAYDVPSGP